MRGAGPFDGLGQLLEFGGEGLELTDEEPALAFGDNSPHITVATPGVGNGSIERFTARFSQPMVALGDPRTLSLRLRYDY